MKVTATFLPCLLVALAMFAGCGKDPALAAIETDANGFICMKCGAKFYTSRRVFMDGKCPKCQQSTLEDAIGYFCEKDQHLTIRPKVSGPEGAATCEKCGVHLQNAMMRPRENDLKAWGAIPAPSSK